MKLRLEFIAAIVTIIAGYLGAAILAETMNWPDGGSVIALKAGGRGVSSGTVVLLSPLFSPLRLPIPCGRLYGQRRRPVWPRKS